MFVCGLLVRRWFLWPMPHEENGLPAQVEAEADESDRGSQQTRGAVISRASMHLAIAKHALGFMALAAIGHLVC